PEALVERRLRLHDGDARGEGLGRGHREPLEAGGVLVEAPCAQESGVRIDPGAERPTVEHRGVESGSEGGHASSPGARAMSGTDSRVSSSGIRNAVVGAWNRAV